VISQLKRDRATVVVGLSLLCLASLVFFGLRGFWLMRQDYVGEIDRIVPRTARMLGFIQAQEQLLAATTAVEGVMADLTYSADGDGAMTSTSMQQVIRGSLASAGLSVSGSQILPTVRQEGFDQLKLDITVVGNIESLNEAFENLRMLRPLIFVESVNIRSQRSRSPKRRREPVEPSTDPRMLTAQFRLLSLRLIR